MAIRFKLDRREIASLLKNESVRQELVRRANLIHSAINHEGYEVTSSVGRNRARAAVVAASPYARNSNAIHNTLVRNIGAGRG